MHECENCGTYCDCDGEDLDQPQPADHVCISPHCEDDEGYPEEEEVMPNTKQGTELPAGQMRMTIQLTIEGPPEEAGQKLAAILKLLPRETQAEALKQIETRLNEARAKEA